MGRNSDRDVPAYQPNKDRRMKEWKDKKDKEKKEAEQKRKESLQARASEEAKRQVEKEERRELPGPVTPVPMSDENRLDIASMPQPEGVYRKPRRSRKKKFDSGYQPPPTLF